MSAESGKHPGVVWLEHQVIGLKRQRVQCLSLKGAGLEAERARLLEEIAERRAALDGLDARAANVDVEVAKLDEVIARHETLLASARKSDAVAQAVIVHRELNRLGRGQS